MRSIVISIKSICFSYSWIQLLKLVSLLPVQFSNKTIRCSNRKKVLHMLFIRYLYVFRPTVYYCQKASFFISKQVVVFWASQEGRTAKFIIDFSLIHVILAMLLPKYQVHIKFQKDKKQMPKA